MLRAERKTLSDRLLPAGRHHGTSAKVQATSGQLDAALGGGAGEALAPPL